MELLEPAALLLLVLGPLSSFNFANLEDKLGCSGDFVLAFFKGENDVSWSVSSNALSLERKLNH